MTCGPSEFYLLYFICFKGICPCRRALRSQIKAAAEDLAAQQRVDRQLAKETVNAVTAWDEQHVSDCLDLCAPISSSLIPRPNPHSVRCTAAAHLPRFRALALLGRRPPQRVDGLIMPASEKPAQQQKSHQRPSSRPSNEIPFVGAHFPSRLLLASLSSSSERPEELVNWRFSEWPLVECGISSSRNRLQPSWNSSAGDCNPIHYCLPLS
jgi:hypothetical protein